MRIPRSRRVAAAAVVVGLLVTLFLVWSSDNVRHYSAYFDRATGLYTGDAVKVLGVQVGQITGVHQESTRVRVDFTVDAHQRIPDGVKAAIIAPSLVTGRFVQLAPVYSSGPALADGAVIPESRTAVPVEFDEVKSELTTLSKALGPNPQNPQGALNQLIAVTSKNLDASTAADLRSSLQGMADAVSTVSSSRGDVFRTISGLNSFVGNLVRNDASLRTFSANLSQASAWLASSRQPLAASVSGLQSALGDLTTYVRQNRSVISSSISKLTDLSQTLAEEKTQIGDALHRAPTVLDNYYNIEDPYHGGVIGRPVLNYFNNVAQFTCGLALGVGAPAALCSQALQSMIQALHVPL
ncbi:MAG TPA: MCE family protein, partial [Marmoricola sp.]|nr:MCE family protein [Marmoricola sp.]